MQTLVLARWGWHSLQRPRVQLLGCQLHLCARRVWVQLPRARQQQQPLSTRSSLQPAPHQQLQAPRLAQVRSPRHSAHNWGCVVTARALLLHCMVQVHQQRHTEHLQQEQRQGQQQDQPQQVQGLGEANHQVQQLSHPTPTPPCMALQQLTSLRVQQLAPKPWRSTTKVVRLYSLCQLRQHIRQPWAVQRKQSRAVQQLELVRGHRSWWLHPSLPPLPPLLPITPHP